MQESPRGPLPQGEQDGAGLDWHVFQSAFARHSGIDLSAYKETQMRRRIGQWAERHGCRGYADLMRRVKADPLFDLAFRRYLTINTTHFYRDVQVFDTLSGELLPTLLGAERPLRIWSAACSIGAEPYTVAMLLDAEARKGEGGVYPDRHFILATDIDEGALHRAAQGIYQEEYFRELPPSIRDMYCKRKGDEYEVLPAIRQRIRFACHNLLEGPLPDDPFDLILCRNVLIYFVSAVQDRLIAQLVDCLRDGGTLVVGSTEHVRDPSRWGLMRTGYCFYRKGDRA